MTDHKQYNYKWLVKIPAGCFMTGTHRFKTKKEAMVFINKWAHTPNSHKLTYSQLPTPIKAWQPSERGSIAGTVFLLIWTAFLAFNIAAFLTRHNLSALEIALETVGLK